MKNKGEYENELNEIPRKVIVKTLTTTKNVDKVFDFFADMKNMETGGAIQSMEKSEDGWWTFEHSVSGKSRMKHTISREFGIVDHIFIGGGLEWNVFVRVVPNQNGSTTTWTFMRPDDLSDGQFEDQLKIFDIEIDRWKTTLENL
ncbi:MAG: hypothetical protein M3297_02895 [Thermoproteota archaeon]|nr:hypothetical protein [Thermoproteota archaeon]